MLSTPPATTSQRTLGGGNVMPQDHTISSELERWLPIDGWPGYDVSDYGRIHSYWGAGGASKGRRGIGPRPRQVGGKAGKTGYCYVQLFRDDGRGRRQKWVPGIHVLVLQAFVGPRPPGMQACHYDGNRSNNRVDNLRWDTRAANTFDSVKHGTNNFTKLAESDIPPLWARLVAGDSPTEIARDFGVTRSAVGHIKFGNSWTTITRTLPGWPLERKV